MDHQEGMSSTIAPLFKGNDYALWSVRIKGCIMSLCCDIWQFVVDGYTAPATPPIETTGNNLCNENAKATNAILGGLDNPIFVKVIHCKSTK
jgi:hypothetical protein